MHNIAGKHFTISIALINDKMEKTNSKIVKQSTDLQTVIHFVYSIYLWLYGYIILLRVDLI
jgi:hypothetical protein